MAEAQREGRLQPDNPGPGGREKKTFGVIKQGKPLKGFQPQSNMTVSVFYKTLISLLRVDWSEASDGVSSQVLYLCGFSWFLFFLLNLPPLYVKLSGSSVWAVIFSSRHGDVICIIEVE